jgi:flagellar biosynthetic protein FliR
VDLTRVAIEQFLRFVLVVGRVAGLFLLAPMLGATSVPERVKVALAAMVALVVLPVLPAGAGAAVGALNLGAYVVVLLGELVIGLAIGLVAAMLLSGVEMAGLFVGQQTGTALANVINPFTETESSDMGQFYSFFALAVFLVIGGHRMLVAAVLRSFEAVPLGGFRFNLDLASAVVPLAGQIFVVALTLSAPVVVTLVLTTIALGFMARTMPQLNIFSTGFPVRLLLGPLVVLLSIGAVGFWSRDLFLSMFDDLADLIALM